ncbi:MAG: aldehyde dehydrogenase family protein [Bacteroidota bacterium]|jgi:glyceraldehyde-3-phosphate dehydrogenase (NADP+)
MQEKRFIVGGEKTESSEIVSVRNPFTGNKIADICLAQASDIEEAIQLSGEAFKSTSKYSGFERSQILQNIANSLRKRYEEFALLITEEAGKPVRFSRSEVDRAIATFEIAAEEAKRISGEVIPLDVTNVTKGKQGIVQRFPIGIISCISPFNFPLNLVAHKIAPAIASGNAFILKPPPQTPLTSLLLGECLLESGIDKRTINVLPCSNENAERLVTDENIAMLSFTGSAKIGWMLKTKAGKKKVVLELGGNAAVIVDKSADCDLAVSRCVTGGFGYAGQVCIKVQRIFVHKECESEFTKKLIEAAGKVKSGDPADEETIAGPMISENEIQRVHSWVMEASESGAKILAGGKRKGMVYEPTILSNVKQSMKVCSEEIFGPVVTLQSFSSIQEAVIEINNSKYGLQAGIFSNDFKNIQFTYKHLSVGGVIVNEYPTFRADSMPYGGVKDSGFGREGIRSSIQEMTEPKLLVWDF